MENRRPNALQTYLTKLNTFCATVAGLVLLFITFSIFVDVILRYFFSRPSIWITEVSTYLFLYVIFLGTAYALQQGAHIRVTFLLDRFGTKSKRILDIVTSLFCIVFTAVLVWQGSIMTWSAFKENWTTPTMLNAPYAYIHLAIVIGSFLLLLTFISNLLIQFRSVSDEGEKG